MTKEVENYLATEGAHNYFDMNEAMVLGTYKNVNIILKYLTVNKYNMKQVLHEEKCNTCFYLQKIKNEL